MCTESMYIDMPASSYMVNESYPDFVIYIPIARAQKTLIVVIGCF